MINNKGVRELCTCKQVQSRIEHIEQQFQSAHNWATHTGQGIEEYNPDSFHAAVEKRDVNIILTSWKSSLKSCLCTTLGKSASMLLWKKEMSILF